MGNRDHLLTCAYTKCHQGKEQSIGTRTAADCMLDPAVVSNGSLKRFDFLAQDKLLAFEDPLNRSHDFTTNCVILRAQVYQRNNHAVGVLPHLNDIRYSGEFLR